MAKNTRQQFVQARLKAINEQATPEQRVKLRKRFDVLSTTKEGRTRIAQVVLPDADAKTRAALKKSLVPQRSKVDTGGSGTGSASTGSSTGSSTSSGTGSGSNKSTGTTGTTGTTSTTSTTSTTIVPKIVVTPTTLPNNTTSTTMVKNNTSTSSTSTTSTLPVDRISPPSSPSTTVFTNSESSAVVPAASKTQTNNLPPGIFENFKLPPVAKKTPEPKDVVYGDQPAEKVALLLEKYNVPILSRIAGIGKNLDAGKNKEAGLGLLNAVAVAAIARSLPQVIGAVKTGQLALQTARSLKNQNTRLENEFRLSEALKYERTSENAQTVRSNFGTVAEQRAENPLARGNKDFKFPPIKDQQKAYEYKPVTTRAGEPGTSGKNFSLDEYGRPVKLPKIK